jgi:opine dehydrogenase
MYDRRDGVCIVGAGHVGLTLYCDIRSNDPHRPITVLSRAYRPGVHPYVMRDILSGDVRSVVAHPRDFVRWADAARVRSALRGSDTVIVTVPDIPSARAAVLDVLHDSIGGMAKNVVFMRAGQGGALQLARDLAGPSGQRWDCLFVEDAFYGTRVSGAGIDYKRKSAIAVAHQGPDYAAGAAAVRRLFDGSGIGDFVRKSPLELLFDPLGYYIHTAVCLDPGNVALTRAGRTYLHYSEGIGAELAAALDAMDRERVALAARYGVSAELFPDILWRQYGHVPGADFHETMRTTGYLYKSRSPGSLAELRGSRSLHEDIPALVTILALAELAGQSMPATRAFFDMLPGRLESIGQRPSDVAVYPVPEGISSPADVVWLLGGAQPAVSAGTPQPVDRWGGRWGRNTWC